MMLKKYIFPRKLFFKLRMAVHIIDLHGTIDYRVYLQT